jgi:hypothetical protein
MYYVWRPITCGYGCNCARRELYLRYSIKLTECHLLIVFVDVKNSMKEDYKCTCMQQRNRCLCTGWWDNWGILVYQPGYLNQERAIRKRQLYSIVLWLLGGISYQESRPPLGPNIAPHHHKNFWSFDCSSTHRWRAPGAFGSPQPWGHNCWGLGRREESSDRQQQVGRHSNLPLCWRQWSWVPPHPQPRGRSCWGSGGSKREREKAWEVRRERERGGAAKRGSMSAWFSCLLWRLWFFFFLALVPGREREALLPISMATSNHTETLWETRTPSWFWYSPSLLYLLLHFFLLLPNWNWGQSRLFQHLKYH